MKMNLFCCFCMVLLTPSCEPPPLDGKSDAYNPILTQKDHNAGILPTSGKEEYIMITTSINLPLYVRHEQAAFLAWGRKMNIKTTILGPAEWDVSAQIATIEQVIPSHPAGLLINGTDPGIAQAINKAVDAGIPTIVYDSEIPGSRRHCFIGSNWYEMGRLLGERMVKLLQGKGKVACLGILGQENMEAGMLGLQDVIKKYPAIHFMGKYDDKANVETAAKITADLIAANPDLEGIAGFDSNSGPGMCLSVREAGKAGKIKLTCIDAEPEHVRLIKEGILDYAVGQKRELFATLGAQFLFTMRHPSLQFSQNDTRAGILPVPDKVSTGSIGVDKQNISFF
ncbi:substrate-binding domain-containing protein [Flavitalea flava]